MKKIISKLILFSFITTIIFITITISINNIISNKKLFIIKDCPENLIFGHSHTEEAFDDSKIKNSKNLSISGENSFYTYFKIKEILKSNDNIKNIFISFTNHQILKNYDETSLWDDSHINHSFSKYAAFMSFDDYLVLFKNNPTGVLKAQPFATKKYLMFTLKNKTSIYDEYLIGGFNKIKTSKLDSILKNKSQTIKFNSVNFKYPKYTLTYIDKIIELCENKKIKIFLTRTPVHKSWNELNDEYYFQKIINEKYAQIDFLDFKNFPLQNKDYFDQSHLNEFGAAKFSVFFNNLLQNGLIQKSNKQEFINIEMSKINYN